MTGLKPAGRIRRFIPDRQLFSFLIDRREKQLYRYYLTERSITDHSPGLFTVIDSEEITVSRFILFFCFSIGLSGLTGPATAENQWEKVGEDNGVTVYTRPVEGFGVKQFKGITDIEAPLAVLYEILKDSEGFSEWFGDCLKQETTAHIDACAKYFHHIVKVPVLKDRNLVGKVTFELDPRGRSLKARITALTRDMIPESFQAAAWIPESSDFVRITDLYCNIEVSSRGPSTSTVVYEVLVDPAGWIPAWVANYFAVKNPETTLANLKKMVKRQKYWERAGKTFRHGLVSSTTTGSQ